MIYRTDYHIHTKYSDGHGWPEDYIPYAIKAGLSEIGFSDHLTLTDEQQDWSIRTDLLDEYCERIIKLGQSTSGIKVKLGVEVDYFPARKQEIMDILQKYPFDYVIGSVHYLGEETVDLGPEYYRDKNLEELYSRYFRTVAEAAETGMFDIMGHPDLVRIFGYIPTSDLTGEYMELARRIRKADVCIEINTNGRNKPLGDVYPDPVYLKVFIDENVPVVINSDSHFPEGVAQYFDEAYSLLISTGCTEMARFSQRTRSIEPIDGRLGKKGMLK